MNKSKYTCTTVFTKLYLRQVPSQLRLHPRRAGLAAAAHGSRLEYSNTDTLTVE